MAGKREEKAGCVEKASMFLEARGECGVLLLGQRKNSRCEVPTCEPDLLAVAKFQRRRGILHNMWSCTRVLQNIVLYPRFPLRAGDETPEKQI